MNRVLHLLASEPDHQTKTSARHLTEDSSRQFEIETRTIGRGGSYSTILSAIMNLRRREEQFDAVHVWGEQALLVSALAIRAPIIYSPDRFPSRQSIHRLRATMSARDIEVIAPTDTMRRAFVTRGVPIERCHLIRPGVEFASINRRRDSNLRQKLGFGADDYIMLAPGESTQPAAHKLAVWTASILHVLDPRYRLLLWGRGPLIAQAQRLSIRTRQPGLVQVAEHRLNRRIRFEQLLGATDLVLITATGPVSTLPISICMAAGLPIVALVTPTVAELLEDRHTALMVGTTSPRLLAQRVLDLGGDSGMQWSISDMARTEAYEYFSLTRFLEQYRAVYRQVISGQAIQVPQQAPGAGLRFHGRV